MDETVHEQVDENTGLSAMVIMESPDEKKQPRIEIQGRQRQVAASLPAARGAHLMVHDGDQVSPGEILAKMPKETTRPRTSRAVCHASWSCSRRAGPRSPP